MAKNLKKYIKEFIDHVNELENEEDLEGNGFNQEYRQIQEYQIRKRRENSCSQECGKIYNNLKKNRYKDILPYDDHRVVLTKIEGDEDSDYINASKLMGVRGTGGYIASQGPLAATVNDYWRMAWENDVEIIFMACRIVEMGKIKCKQYWNDAGKSTEFGDITVLTEKEEVISEDYIKRLFVVSKGEEERRVVQFHYSGWPDHGIPRDPELIMNLIGEMRGARQNDQARLLVHCSAGCGRTGAIIAIDFVWTLLEEGRLNETFSLYELVCNFRDQRMSIVQTAEQYALVNQVLRSLCQQWMDKMANHTYENVQFNIGGEVSLKARSAEAEEEEYCDVATAKEAILAPEKPPRQEEVLVQQSPPSSSTGPEVIEVIPPSQRVKKNSKPAATYENTVLKKDLPEKPPKAAAPPPPSPTDPSLAAIPRSPTDTSSTHTAPGVPPSLAERKPETSAPLTPSVAKSSQQPEDSPVHRTVIKVSSTGLPKSKQTDGSAGSNVIYMVGSHKTSATIPSSPKSSSPEESPYSMAKLPDGPTSSQKTMTDGPTRTSSQKTMSTNPLQTPSPSDGFGERLPRVSGPRPAPHSWT